MVPASNPTARDNFLLEIADDHLILGHRLSQWCGHGPTLEEDIALSNLALDCIGAAKLIYEIIESRSAVTADGLAFFRSENEFKNCLLVEQENGHFGVTITRQLFFDIYYDLLFSRLAHSADSEIAAVATKLGKETNYHLRHSSSWFIRLGDGTTESQSKIQEAVDLLWPFVSELFIPSPGILRLKSETSVITELDCSRLTQDWEGKIRSICSLATVNLTELPPPPLFSGRLGKHSECLGHLLAEMQSTARAFPGVKW